MKIAARCVVSRGNPATMSVHAAPTGCIGEIANWPWCVDVRLVPKASWRAHRRGRNRWRPRIGRWRVATNGAMRIGRVRSPDTPECDFYFLNTGTRTMRTHLSSRPDFVSSGTVSTGQCRSCSIVPWQTDTTDKHHRRTPGRVALNRSCSRLGRFVVIGCVALLLQATEGLGENFDYTWTGTGSNNSWFNADDTLVLSDNWDYPGESLSSNKTLLFGSSSRQSPDQNGNATITNLVFQGGAPTYTLGSTIGSTLTILESLSNQSSSLQTINNTVAFIDGASAVDTSGGAITLATIGGNGNFNKDGSGGTLTIGNASGYFGRMIMLGSSGSVVDAGGNFGGSISVNGGVFSGATVVGDVVTDFDGTAFFSNAGKVTQNAGTIVFSTGTVSQSSSLSGTNSITGSVGSSVTFNDGLLLNSTNRTTFRLAAAGVADEYVVNTNELAYGGTMTLNFTSSGTETIGTIWSVFDPNNGVSGELAGIVGTGSGPYASLTWTTATSSLNVFDQRYGDGIWLSSWTDNGTSSQRLIFNQTSGDIIVVPEPSTIVMAGAGVAGVAFLRWRRVRSRRSAAVPESAGSTGNECRESRVRAC
jgi:hypothetical protein